MNRPKIFLIIACIVLFGTVMQRRMATGSSTTLAAAQPLMSEVNVLANKISAGSESAHLYGQLGLAYLQEVRESGDFNGYNLAEEAFIAALERDPKQIDALQGQAMLAAARHEFVAAIEWAKQAQSMAPQRAAIQGILVDAYVELGEYDLAVAQADAMTALRPDIGSYSRIAYLRELHGDVDGAITAMEAAVEAGNPAHEATHWALVQLGNLYFDRGGWDSAESHYKTTLQLQPTYPYALAGIGRVAAARGDYNAAIAIYEPLVQRLPLPEFAQALGDLYFKQGKLSAAEQQYRVVDAAYQLNKTAGMNVDLEVVIFEVEHRFDPDSTVAVAQTIYANRPTVFAADTLAWALFHAGKYEVAQHYSEQALRLGTRNAQFYYHAGWIADALGDLPLACDHFETANRLNSAFQINTIMPEACLSAR